MSHQIPVNGVYFHVLRGNQYAFADERTKKYLLSILEEEQKHAHWHIYAFCMTNQEAYFIVATENMAVWEQDLQQATEQFLDTCRCRLPKWWSDEIKVKVGQARKLQTGKQVREYCYRLHQIPLECGYTERLSDYWWSSYLTYAGIYDWPIVECKWILQQFSDRPSIARQKLKECHVTTDITFESIKRDAKI